MNDELKFAHDEPIEGQESALPWKVLIVDDEDFIHTVTKLVLKDIEFEGRPIEFVSAFSGEEAIQIMEEQKDVVLILLDVVMENDHAGLDVAKYIRQTLNNKMVRIILRTGQPGQAPEQDVISEYDINDYKEKTDLTAQKLFTTIIAALRSYRDLNIIAENKIGLEKIIAGSNELFKIQSLEQFSQGVLTQLAELARFSSNGSNVSGLGLTHSQGVFTIIAGIGKYKSEKGLAYQVLSKQVITQLNKVVNEKKSVFFDDGFIAYYEGPDGEENLVYFKGFKKINDLLLNLLSLFSSNIKVALDNIYLNRKIIESHQEKLIMQRSVLAKLSEIIALRSQETGSHIRRVAEYSCFLARKLGLPDSEIEILTIVSPLHDIGKIAIPDAILLKPDRLTPEEFEVVKSHARLGGEMLHNEKSPLLESASIIAATHHEKWDGSGYPNGLTGEEIPLFGRITSICDVFDALTSKRVYKKEWTIDHSIEEIRKMREFAFDPVLVDCFIEHIGDILKIKEKLPDE